MQVTALRRRVRNNPPLEQHDAPVVVARAPAGRIRRQLRGPDVSHRPQPDTRDRYRHHTTLTTRWMDNDIYGHGSPTK